MAINLFVTSKNAEAVLYAISEDLNPISVNSFADFLNENKKHLSPNSLFKFFSKMYEKDNLNEEYKKFFKNEALILLENTFDKEKESGVIKLIDKAERRFIVKIFLASNLPDKYKVKYFKNHFKNYYIDDMYDEAIEIYHQYESVHIDEDNYTSWCFNDNPQYVVQKLMTNEKFKGDVIKLCDINKLHLLVSLCDNKNKITQKEFKDIIPCFESLLRHKDFLNINSLGVNKKTFIFYEENKINLKEMFSKTSFFDFLRYNTKLQKTILEKLQKEGNSFLFDEQDVVNNILSDNFVFAEVIDSWSNIKDFIKFNKSNISLNVNFFNLTQKIMKQVDNDEIKEKLQHLSHEMEKCILEEKIIEKVNIPSKKMKI
jgi:hypothetical protein